MAKVYPIDPALRKKEGVRLEEKLKLIDQLKREGMPHMAAAHEYVVDDTGIAEDRAIESECL